MGKKTLCAATLLACLMLCAAAKAQGLSVVLPDAVRQCLAEALGAAPEALTIGWPSVLL